MLKIKLVYLIFINVKNEKKLLDLTKNIVVLNQTKTSIQLLWAILFIQYLK